MGPSDDLQKSSSPQAMAKDWIITKDKLFLCPDDKSLIQRYALAALYYSTDGDTWSDNRDFLSAEDECKWRGVSCNTLTGELNGIDLAGNELGGEIPAEIIAFSSMKALQLGNNNIVGKIPIGIYNITSLVDLDLSGNRLGGRLEKEVVQLDALRSFKINDNRMAHRIPRELKDMNNVQIIQLHNNSFYGEMPSRVCNLFRPSRGNLRTLTADCAGDFPEVVCDCCT